MINGRVMFALVFPDYGFLSDAVGVHWATVATGATALAVFPFAFALAPRLGRGSAKLEHVPKR